MRDVARASIHDDGDQLTTDGLDRRTTASRRGDRVEVAARLERASALSRAIRDTLTPEVRCSITSDPQAAARLEALDATCYRIELTRNVHNVDVAGGSGPAFRTNGKIAQARWARSDTGTH